MCLLIYYSHKAGRSPVYIKGILIIRNGASKDLSWTTPSLFLASAETAVWIHMQSLQAKGCPASPLLSLQRTLLWKRETPNISNFYNWIGCKFLKTSSAGSFCLNSSFLNLTLFSCIVLQSEKRTQAAYSTVDLEISSVKYLRPSLIRSIFNLYNKNHAYSILE